MELLLENLRKEGEVIMIGAQTNLLDTKRSTPWQASTINAWLLSTFTANVLLSALRIFLGAFASAPAIHVAVHVSASLVCFARFSPVVGLCRSHTFPGVTPKQTPQAEMHLQVGSVAVYLCSTA